MRKFLLIFFVVGLPVVCCSAQSDAGMDASHERYWEDHRSDLKLEKTSVEVLPEKIPSKLRKALDGNDLYKGWKDSPLYFDQKSNLFTLYIKRDSTISAYGFNDKGNAVTFDSYTVHDQ